MLCPIHSRQEPFDFVVEKDCCGSILIQDKKQDFQIWEFEVESSIISLIQISVFSNANSTHPLIVEIECAEKIRVYVPPGNTTNFIGQNIHAIKVFTESNEEDLYVEGKYTITSTIQLKVPTNSD